MADWLGVTLQELFDGWLAVDSYAGDGIAPISVLSPAVLPTSGLPRGEPGTPGTRFSLEWDFRPRRCVFLTADGRCAIHPVKPFVCRDVSHDDPPTLSTEQLVEHWEGDRWQQQCDELLAGPGRPA